MCDCNCEKPKSDGERIKECKLKINKLIAEDQRLYKKYVIRVRKQPDEEQNLRWQYFNSRSEIVHDIEIYKAELKTLTLKNDAHN